MNKVSLLKWVFLLLMTSQVAAVAADVTMDSVILTPRSAPGSPSNGQCWTATTGLFCRINGGTIGPYGTGGGGGGLTINSTTISGGAANRVLIDDGTKLQELVYGLTGNSTLVETTSGGLLTPSILPLATSGAFGAVKVDGTTITASGGVITAVGAASSSITPGTTTVVGATAPCLIENSASTTMACAAVGTGAVTALANAVNTSGGLLTSAVPDGQTIVFASNKLSTNAPVRTAASPTIVSTDFGGTINISSGGLTVPATSTFVANATVLVVNYGGSTAAVSTTPTINAGGGCVSGTGIPAGAAWQMTSNGTTIDCAQTISTASSASSITPGTTTIVGSTAPCLIENSASTTMACAAVGTGVVTALGNNLSAAGGVSSTIASGTSALGTGAIGSAACATAVTTTATNTATTDVISWGFNGDPTGVTGYTPVTSGALTIFAYPSANNVNFKVCNLSTSSITPGAITLNWRVIR